MATGNELTGEQSDEPPAFPADEVDRTADDVTALEVASDGQEKFRPTCHPHHSHLTNQILARNDPRKLPPPSSPSPPSSAMRSIHSSSSLTAIPIAQPASNTPSRQATPPNASLHSFAPVAKSAKRQALSTTARRTSSPTSASTYGIRYLMAGSSAGCKR